MKAKEARQCTVSRVGVGSGLYPTLLLSKDRDKEHVWGDIGHVLLFAEGYLLIV